tara:strand:+ start:2917 stop:4290 length:1374 start_codon:yes stop_codon:yes gene_type:complete
MAQLSKFNNTYNALNASDTFVGQLESTADLVSISVNTHCEQACRVIIKQYRARDLQTQVQENAEDVAADTRQLVQTPIKAHFYLIEVVNLEAVDMSFSRITTYLQSTHYSNLDIRKLSEETDKVISYGQNSNFDFYPTVDNNTIQIYADGAKGTNVTGGWQYTNTAANKINWYLYQAPVTSTGSPITAGQTVASVKSMYAVINQQSTLGLDQAQNPWIMIYTIPDSGVNASWYKSKLFYGSNAHTDICGNKLLYTGEDPLTIHPEITGINRIKLDFNLSLSTKTEEAAAAELVGAGTLQTTALTPVGQFNFTMSQFGVDWEKVSRPIPIENGKVVVDTGVITCLEKSPTGAVTNILGNTGDLVTGVHSTLQSLTLADVGGTVFSYVKLYNKATAPTASDTPVITLPLNHDTVQQVECHSLDFTLGIGLRATLNFAAGDTTAPSGTVYATAFYTNVIN